MSLGPIRKLFVIHFGIVLWLRNLLHCIRLTSGTWYLCHHESVLLALVRSTRLKPNLIGSIKRYKTRFVAKGYSHEYGMDYEETFALVAKMITIRTLIAVASSFKWKISQMDVKNAFLNGDLNEEV
ncbi:gag-pol polyprotein, partial [Tanacetum coccineum]